MAAFSTPGYQLSRAHILIILSVYFENYKAAQMTRLYNFTNVGLVCCCSLEPNNVLTGDP